MKKARCRIQQLHPVAIWHPGHNVPAAPDLGTESPMITQVPSNVWHVPPGNLFWNIPILWEILDRVVDDWRRIAQRYQRIVDAAVKTSGESGGQSVFAPLDVKSHHVQGLFSYITFFRMLEDAYESFYRLLNELNKEMLLNVKHSKPPHETNLHSKITIVGNKSVAHLGGKIRSKSLRPFTAELEAKDVIDSLAGLQWDLAYPMAQNGSIRVEGAVFGGFGTILQNRLTGEEYVPQDRQLDSIPSLHTTLSDYLAEYDRVCSDFLSAIQSKLPLEINGVRYTA